DPALYEKARALPSAVLSFHEGIGQRHDREYIGSAKAPHPLRSLDEIANADVPARGASWEAEPVHRGGGKEVNDVLRLPWSAQFAVRTYDPIFLWCFCIELFYVGKFPSGFEYDRFNWYLVFPLLHCPADIDRHELKVGGYFFTLAGDPHRFVGEFKQRAYDHLIG